ncbi:MAG: DUF2202 domain-containing protein [Anaerolineales bacterium]|nr:DUF2202 domain-containing protein [Anaerolineales bacterium]
MPTSKRIASSEAAQPAAVARPLDSPGIDDPAEDSPERVLADSQLQAPYDPPLLEGSDSLEAAPRAAALVEGEDIRDLEEHLAETADPSLQRVTIKLLQGSRNQLRAFVAEHERRSGHAYSPQTRDPGEVQKILALPVERGRGRRFN